MPAPEPGPVEALREAIRQIRATRTLAGAAGLRIAVAFSGGLDSTVLLHAAARLLPAGSLWALHVDHGLQAGSVEWAAHCGRQAEAVGATFLAQRLPGAPGRAESLEAWAREQRYAALAVLAARADADALLTAHHLDDQLETLLMRLARGAGLDGLAGIEALRLHGDLLLCRPFLTLPRERLAGWARAEGLSWIEDPSNGDPRFLRNAIRHQLLPAIEQVLPGLRRQLPATLADLREARERLREADRQLFGPLAVESPEFGCCLALPGWRALPERDRLLALRQWLARHGLRMPSRARLAEMANQLESTRPDNQLALRHDGRVIRRHRDLAVVTEGRLPPAGPQVPGAGAAEGAGVAAAGAGTAGPLPFVWHGQPRIDCPAFGGSLLLSPVAGAGEPGLPAALLRADDLVLRARTGGERLRSRPGGPRRSLKNLFQERGIPAWQRDHLPVMCLGGHAVWVARLGPCADHAVVAGERYRVEWHDKLS